MRTKKRGTALIVSMISAISALNTGSLAAASAAEENVQAVFYVSPEGSDSGDGSADAPFATLERARDAVREINASMTGDIIVYLRGGDYRITKPVEFDTRDSGNGGFTVRYEAYEGETPVLNGAQRVKGWEKFNDKLWAAPLDRDIKLRNLYVNDHRANMGSVTVQAKGGYGDYYVTAGQADWAFDSGRTSDGVVYSAGDMPRITSNFDDLEVVNGTTWNENIICSRDIKYDGGNMILLMQQPYGAIAQTPGWNCAFSCGGQHTIYNAFSFVDSEGEFYFDKTEHMLYYYPYEWEDMTEADAEAPVADALININGRSTSERVENITFSGITFANTDYQLTDVAGSHGKTTCQAAQTYIAFADSNWHSKKYEMVDTLPAAINVTNGDNINFIGNVIKHTGADGLSMPNDVINSTVSGNYITDITSSGITIGHPQHVYIGDGDGSNREKYPRGIEGICKNDTVCDNLLYDISVVHGFGGCAAVTAYFVDSVKILRNQVQKTAYNGIHLGWGWNMFLDSETCRDNMICYNRVIDAVNRLHDSGAIYTIGQMPGTVINENYVQGIPAGGFGAPTYGLHNDDGTAWIEEFDNVLDIDKNVTYTINCEDFGIKHHLNIKRTYATVNKMGKNPPDCDIDAPIVVADAVWPLRQYEICLNSGLQDEYKGIMPKGMMSEADYIFPASCATTCGSKLPVRKTEGTVWIAPEGTESFKAGADMTKASGSKGEIKTPSKEGEYRIYVLDADGKVLSRSEHILRLSGSGSADGSDVIQAENYDFQSGIENENCSEGGLDAAFIENGDYIGFKDIDLDNVSDIDFRIGSNGAKASLEVRLDSSDGKLIGKLDVSETGGWQTWKTQNCKIDETTGKHDVYFVFTGGEGYLFNVNWWRPNKPAQEYIYGDANIDGEIDMSDVVLIMQALANPNKYGVDGTDDGHITEEGFEYADADGDGLTVNDALRIQQYLLGLIPSLT